MTLKQISRLSGYSISTVSKALNNRKDISDITKRKIQELAKDHNYTPNMLAVSLRKQKTKTVAVIVPDILNQQFAGMVSEAQKLSFKKGLKLLFFQHFENHDLENESIGFLNNGAVDGAIIIPSKSNKNYSSCSIPIPNVIVKLKKSGGLNLDNKKITDDYFNKLMEMIG